MLQRGTPLGSRESLHWKFAADGCRGVFRLGDVAAHEKTCDFALVRCGYPSESWNRAEKCQRRSARHRGTPRDVHISNRKVSRLRAPVQVRRARARVGMRLYDRVLSVQEM